MAIPEEIRPRMVVTEIKVSFLKDTEEIGIEVSYEDQKIYISFELWELIREFYFNSVPKQQLITNIENVYGTDKQIEDFERSQKLR